MVGQRNIQDAKVRIIITEAESLLEAEVRIIEEDSRHLARIIARA